MNITELTKSKSFKLASVFTVGAFILIIILLATKVVKGQLGFILLGGVTLIYAVSIFLIYSLNQDEVNYEKETIGLEKEIELSVEQVKKSFGDFLVIDITKGGESRVELIGDTTKTPISIIFGELQDSNMDITILNNLNNPKNRQIRKGHLTESKLRDAINRMATETVKENKTITITKNNDGSSQEVVETKTGDDKHE